MSAETRAERRIDSPGAVTRFFAVAGCYFYFGLDMSFLWGERRLRVLSNWVIRSIEEREEEDLSSLGQWKRIHNPAFLRGNGSKKEQDKFVEGFFRELYAKLGLEYRPLYPQRPE